MPSASTHNEPKTGKKATTKASAVGGAASREDTPGDKHEMKPKKRRKGKKKVAGGGGDTIFNRCKVDFAGPVNDKTVAQNVSKGRMKVRAKGTKTKISQRYKTQIDLDSMASSETESGESSQDDSETEQDDDNEEGCDEQFGTSECGTQTPESTEMVPAQSISPDDELDLAATPRNSHQNDGSQDPTETDGENASSPQDENQTQRTAVPAEQPLQSTSSKDLMVPAGSSCPENDLDDGPTASLTAHQSGNGSARKGPAMKRKDKDEVHRCKIKKAKLSPQEEFELYVHLESVKALNTIPYHKSTKLHILLATTEFEGYRKKWDKARKALHRALQQSEKHSNPGAEDLAKFAERCKEKDVPLRAALLHVLSATMKKQESNKFPFFVSQRIFEVSKLVKSMVNKDPREEMTCGSNYKQAAQFAVPLMVQMYEEGCSKKGGVTLKAYALSWIAVAYCDIEDYRGAVKYGEEGRDIMEKEFPDQEKRYAKQIHARLLQSIGLAYENLDDYSDTVALEISEESVLATQKATDFESKSAKETALSIRKSSVERLKKKLEGKPKEKKKEESATEVISAV